ncbi:hypothetical protein NLU13_9180 [Sarocladium strictum]|uniref:Nab2-like CCCH zinc finger domain-containing protein n=1 Tax=Sarocladium strictum TaxID=5046 RepID=A0AA39L3Y3_SARSR|nr:hypothetical protein NLU13_9180 [Sarocladium strictum]
MSIEVPAGSPLAEALASAILPKLVEAGWGTGGDEDGALAEYIVLMVSSGKTQEQIAHELSSELLSLSSDDPAVLAFSQWLFETLPQLNSQVNGGGAAQSDAMNGEMDTDMGAESSELNAPTGPRSMRTGGPRGGRDKRMLGHMHKAMDRGNEAAIHRVRQTGNERIGRTPPAGPRGGPGRIGRHNNNRAASLQQGLANMGNQGQGWMMGGQQPNNMELVAMLEQQNQMMYQLSQQLLNNGGGRGRGGKSLFDRAQNPNQRGNQRRGGGHHGQAQRNNGEGAQGNVEDMDMSGDRPEPPNPDETVCKYNLRCTNKDCKFAHQSPAAPPGTNVDVTDVCTFGAACKNRKCTGRHPSPATKLAHQSEQDCKFWPNCQNEYCPFKHPSAPPCRNGANCSDANCKFTHVKIKCKFNPCKNKRCPFVHEEGQQGGFRDKVWTPGGDSEHLSQRTFADESAPVENVTAEDDAMKPEQSMQETDVIG